MDFTEEKMLKRYQDKKILNQDIISTKPSSESLKVFRSSMPRTNALDNEMSYVAIKMVLDELLLQLDIIRSTMIADTSYLPHKLFDWSLVNRVARYKMKNLTFLDVLEREVDGDELESVKLKVDISELIDLTDYMRLNWRNGTDFVNEIFERLDTALITAKFTEYFSAPIEKAKEEYKRIYRKYFVQALTLCLSQTLNSYKRQLDVRSFELDNISPIESRYIINWYENKVEQCAIKDKNTQTETLNSIDYFGRLKNQIIYVSKCSLDMYFIICENLRSKIYHLSNKFEDDLQAIDEENTILNTKITNLRYEIKLKKEELEMFVYKIDKMLQKIVEEEEEQAKPKVNVKKAKAKGKGKRNIRGTNKNN